MIKLFYLTKPSLSRLQVKLLKKFIITNKPFYQQKRKLQEYATIYFIGKKFKVDKKDPRKLMTYFNSQTNKSYPFRLGLSRLKGWNLIFSKESNFVFKPTLLEKLSEKIL